MEIEKSVMKTGRRSSLSTCEHPTVRLRIEEASRKVGRGLEELGAYVQPVLDGRSVHLAVEDALAKWRAPPPSRR